MPKRETPYAQAEQKVVPTTTDSNVKVEKVEKIIEKVVVEEKKSPVVVEDPSMYQRGIIFKNLSIILIKKSPNFIRTKGRHFDNLMTWLVRLGSIK